MALIARVPEAGVISTSDRHSNHNVCLVYPARRNRPLFSLSLSLSLFLSPPFQPPDHPLKLLAAARTFEKVIFVSAILSPLERMITSSVEGDASFSHPKQGWINLMRNPVTEIHNLCSQRENHIPPQVANSNIKRPPGVIQRTSSSCFAWSLRVKFWVQDVSISFLWWFC